MKRIRMLETTRTEAGMVLRAGKPYYVTPDVAEAMVAAGRAIDLDAPTPEVAATRTRAPNPVTPDVETRNG